VFTVIQFSTTRLKARKEIKIHFHTERQRNQMQLFDQTFATPAENLAADEALLDWREQNGGEEILRFWESPETFAVVGYANKIATEVNVAACEENQIPILRRCSGGGTVLQGRGCLNYGLILRTAENSPLAGFSEANRFIMERNREAIESELRSPNSISVCGHTGLGLCESPGVVCSVISTFSGR